MVAFTTPNGAASVTSGRTTSAYDDQRPACADEFRDDLDVLVDPGRDAALRPVDAAGRVFGLGQPPRWAVDAQIASSEAPRGLSSGRVVDRDEDPELSGRPWGAERVR